MTASFAILTDITRCTGCERCVQACKQIQRKKHLMESQSDSRKGSKDQPKSDPSDFRSYTKDLPRPWKHQIDDLSSTRYTTILRPNNHFVRQQCRHCLEPACVSACLVGALQKTPEGPVIYDWDKCMGCRYCMMACPYGIPRYNWEARVPSIQKCDMCYTRLLKRKQPGCVEACPEKATIFGKRSDLIDEAKRRIKESPDKYKHRVFGETEIGGTSVIYLSDIPLDFLAFQPDLGNESLPDRTWAALSKVPSLALGMGGVMAGVWWIIGRRMQMEEANLRTESTNEE